jgi:nicotinamidase/pyrazinamidase
MKTESIKRGDALIVVDMQNDFLPGGRLAVPGSEQVIPVINRCIKLFCQRGAPIFMTRDWHPVGHFSFRAQGGPWPTHCVAGSYGAEFSWCLALPETVQIISKGVQCECEGYSGFDGTDLHARLEKAGIERLFVAGLATDYCVLHTVLDVLKRGYTVFLLEDGVRAVNVEADDGAKALQAMRAQGATLIDSEYLA